MLVKTVVWIPEMSVGNSEIDAQHQLWIGLINELAKAVDTGSTEVAGIIFTEVMTYTSTHFSFEEMAMAKVNYADLERHTQAHRDFILLCESMDVSNRDAALHLLDTMRHWLRQHICVVDKAYEEALRDA